MSEIKVKEIKCPVCGAPLELKDNGYGQTQCEYCRAIVYVDRDDAGQNGEKTIYTADNKAIANVNIPIGWDVKNTFINYDKATIGIPYGVIVDFENNMGSIIHVETGNSFSEFGNQFGQPQSPHTMQKEFETVDKYLDEYVQEIAHANNVEAKFIEELDVPIEKLDKKKDFEDYHRYVEGEIQKNGGGFSILGLYCDSACRAYDCGERVIVACTKVKGYYVGLPGLGALTNGINNMMKGLGNLMGQAKEKATNTTQTMKANANNGSFINRMADSGLLGGMLGKKFRTQQAQQPQEVQQPVEEQIQEQSKDEPQVEEQVQENTNPLYYGQIRKPGIGQSTDWESECIFVLITSKEEYKDLIGKAYKQICSSYKLSQEVLAEYATLKNQWTMQNQSNMNAQAAAQRANGDRLIAIGQQRMAANQSYVNSMMERSNRQYQSQRDSYNSRIAAQDRMRDQRSEAIRGVNTYIKPDGKEVEVPVTADTAWINGKGEIVGGGPGFNPGSGWTKMERK